MRKTAKLFKEIVSKVPDLLAEFQRPRKGYRPTRNIA
jgi:hypothetical protein